MMMMEDEDHSRFVSQLRAEFDGCDASASGFLDRDELTGLFRKLHLDAHLQQLLDTLLGQRACGRVNFEEFKDGFVAVLSHSLVFSTSEDDSSYLEPVIPEEVKPKFVKGKKRYGRRSRPDKPESALSQDSEDLGPSGMESSDLSPSAIRRAKLRRSTSLDSLESLKSDVEPASQGKSDGPRWEEDAEPRVFGGKGGKVVKLLDEDLDVQPGSAEELLQKLDSDVDRHVSQRDLQIVRDCAPLSSSTPWRSVDQRRRPPRSRPALDEHSGRSTTPSLLMATVGQRVLSRLDDGTGCCSPEQVVTVWTEEGIRSSREILQTLDFSLEDRLSLVDLTLALDNELLVSGNGIHQAALISYKNEIQHLQVLAEQACSERDKVKADLDHADQRNLQLVREVDDRHASMENLNQSRIRDLEQDFRDRLTAVRSQVEQESDVFLQQVEQERSVLQEELWLLRAQEAALQEELCAAVQENAGLEQELQELKLQLTEAQNSVGRLQNDLEQLLSDKFGRLDPAAPGLGLDEPFSHLIKEYEQQCRELRDRNDELSSELELLKSQRRKWRRASGGDAAALDWTPAEPPAGLESDSDTSDLKCTMRKTLHPDDKEAVCPLDEISGPTVSIQTEMAVEQLKQKHEEELQQLRIQLETQVNYYERSLELMRQSMELERRDISQTFKLEISELEEQKLQAEQEVKQLQEALNKLQLQNGGRGWSSEQERKMQRERAEMEQNFAREIGNLVQRLSSEKDQLEAELKLKMEQEVSLLRTRLEEVRSENASLQERLRIVQQQVHNMEEEAATRRRKLEELERNAELSRAGEERFQAENCSYREEVLDLSNRNLQLSKDNAELSARLRGDQESVRLLQERLATISREQEEEGAAMRRLQDVALQQEREKLQQQGAWTQEKQLMEKELRLHTEKLIHVSALEAELSSVTLKLQWSEEDKTRLLGESEEQRNKVVELHQSLLSLEADSELLRSQLNAISQEKLSQEQDGSELQRKLQQAEKKGEELQTSNRKLMREKVELHHALEEQEEQISSLQKESHKLQHQNQQLQSQLSEVQVHSLEVKSLKTRLKELEMALTQAEEQAARADEVLSLVQVQQQRGEDRGKVEALQTHLMEEQRRSQQLEETLKHQVQQSSSHISMKQERYEKALSGLQQRVQELETKLKGVHVVLQEKVQQLKEQLVKNAKSSSLLKELHVENAQLITALQVTEERQKNAEKKNFLLEGKISALNRLLRDVVQVALAT